MDKTAEMNVLSLFNGMSFGAMALESAGIEVDKYYSSEIDKYANQATKALYPDVIQLGDVTKWREWDIDFSKIDLLLAGFPCQAWSMAGKQKGDNDPRGALVHDLIDIWNEIKKHNPNMKFMFENVKMKKEFLDYINELFGVEPICINSALVSAQNRKRYYWTNICEVLQPEDKGIILKDILHCESNDVYQIGRGNNKGGIRNNKSPCMGSSSWQENVLVPMSEGWHKWWEKNSEFQLGKKYSSLDADKAITMTARQYASWNGNFVTISEGVYRKLTITECARLQTVPDHKIDILLNAGISNSQLYKMLGNGWTHDVIVHIFKGIRG